MNTLTADVDGRRAACSSDPTRAPFAEQRDNAFQAQLRATTVKRDGKDFYQLDGTASVVDTWYQMYDFWGPYEEQVATGAFDKTLAANPDVAFLLNHRGMTMARTKAGTLELGTNEAGDLTQTAFLNPTRQDVKDLVIAIEDGAVDQMSFAFRIKAGNWNPDYTTYSITEVDLDRGDVSAVNFGANPYTSISARAKLAFLERALPGQTRQDAHRDDVASPAERSGSSLTLAKLRLSLSE
ncbi:HK97 family phage prohead protease [Agromyces sp. NPDC058136]|uniref:HK97 family phage prohead protease n=1 Tax=Agromyces sp. NPDC058136 TaxID=3346354 RepID=UPI0036D9B3DB